MTKQSPLETARAWAQNPLFDLAFRQEIQTLLDSGAEAELTDRFYQDLDFGTGGLRGIMGAGSNRMTLYTVRRATQGLANYILQLGLPQPSVAIAHDSRNNSALFTLETAKVLAANGIKAWVYKVLTPTPMLSFAVRELHCTAGIIITASHNPKEYNGYKVSWSDGCQVTPPHDKGIIDQVNLVDFAAIKVMEESAARSQGLLQDIPPEVEERYYHHVTALSQTHGDANADFPLLYTPLHGTGKVPVTTILGMRGFKKCRLVAGQAEPDGNFSTLHSPNPEEQGAFELAMEEADEDAKLILATDPDADRVGCMVKHQGEWEILNGNQIGQILLFYYLSKLKENQRLPKHGVFVTTIVTSGLAGKIAAKFGLRVVEVLTGFKWIGKVMAELDETGKEVFVMGTEESHGYLFGDFVRDKDAMIACMLLAEAAAELALFNLTLVDLLNQIHHIYDFHTDALVNKTIKGKSGQEKIKTIMQRLREAPPTFIGGISVERITDYKLRKIVESATGNSLGAPVQPASDVIAFLMNDGSRITARPSGTEPKIKFYFNLCGKNANHLAIQRELYIRDFNNLIDEYSNGSI